MQSSQFGLGLPIDVLELATDIEAADQFPQILVEFTSFEADHETLAGHLRGILGMLTVEEIYKDRDAFAQKVLEVSGSDLANMGLEIVSFVIKDIRDDKEYLESLGRTRTAEVKLDAVKGEAEAQRDATIAQANAVASRSASILSKKRMAVSAQTAWVDPDKCISCMTCVHVCPYNAPYMNYDHKGQIEAAKCMGCGICVSECPARAIQLHHFETDQFGVMIRELLACNGSVRTVAAKQHAGELTGKKN